MVRPSTGALRADNPSDRLAIRPDGFDGNAVERVVQDEALFSIPSTIYLILSLLNDAGWLCSPHGDFFTRLGGPRATARSENDGETIPTARAIP